MHMYKEEQQGLDGRQIIPQVLINLMTWSPSLAHLWCGEWPQEMLTLMHQLKLESLSFSAIHNTARDNMTESYIIQTCLHAVCDHQQSWASLLSQMILKVWSCPQISWAAAIAILQLQWVPIHDGSKNSVLLCLSIQQVSTHTHSYLPFFACRQVSRIFLCPVHSQISSLSSFSIMARSTISL